MNQLDHLRFTLNFLSPTTSLSLLYQGAIINTDLCNEEVLPTSTTFLTGDVTLPRDVNTLYLHSDALAGFRDTQGPVQGQRATGRHGGSAGGIDCTSVRAAARRWLLAYEGKMRLVCPIVPVLLLLRRTLFDDRCHNPPKNKQTARHT